MKTTLTTVTVIEIVLLVVVLAACLIVIDFVLRRIASALGDVPSRGTGAGSGGQSPPGAGPVGTRLRDVNYRLERICTALNDVASRRAPGA